MKHSIEHMKEIYLAIDTSRPEASTLLNGSEGVFVQMSSTCTDTCSPDAVFSMLEIKYSSLSVPVEYRGESKDLTQVVSKCSMVAHRHVLTADAAEGEVLSK